MSEPLDYRALRRRGFRVVKIRDDWRVSGYGVDTVMRSSEAKGLLGATGDTLIRHAERPDVASAALRLSGKGYTLHESDAGNVWRVIDNAGNEHRVRRDDLPSVAETLPVLLTDEENEPAVV